jgi:polyhydroxyalkanoate synthesis regulator phasin
MKELLKKGLLVGLGAAEFTRETLAKTIAELEKKGEVSKDEARKIMTSFTKTARKRRKELESGLEKAFASILGKTRIATADRLEELEKRLKNLEKKIRTKK